MSLGSFFKSVENAFARLFGKAPSVLQKASSALSFVAPLLKLVITEVDPKDAPEVGNVIAEVETSMGTASALISQSHNTADITVQAKVATGLNAVVVNLDGLLEAGHIKNPAIQADVKAGLEELQAVIAQLAPVTA